MLGLALLGFAGLAGSASATDFKQHLGLQLWSLRVQTKENPLTALDLVNQYGVVEVETAGTGGLTPAAFAAALKQRGLKAVSAHMGYERLQKDLAGAIAEAKAVGAQYVICPSLPHVDGKFDYRGVAAEFNQWGAACQAAGLRFGYHPHGFEFQDIGDGRTAFDYLVAETKSDLVCFEMDVFWVLHAGVDPVALLDKYPDRWQLMHLKDMRVEAPTGLHTGKAPASDNVAVGQGRIDWKAVLRTAQKIGINYYFIEDETLDPLHCIPVSLGYLRQLQP